VVPKQEVHCPSCGATFKVPEPELDVRIKCGRCKTAFTPKNLLRKSTRKGPGVGGPSSSAVSLILAAVILVVATIVVTNYFSEDKPKEEPFKGSSGDEGGLTPEEVALVNLPVNLLEKWIGAVMTKDQQSLRRITDFGAFYMALPAEGRPLGTQGKLLPYDQLEPLARIEWRGKILAALTDGDLTGPLKGKKFLPGSVQVLGPDRAPLERLHLELTGEFTIPPEVRSLWQLIFTMDNRGKLQKPDWKVSGLRVGKAPEEKKKKKKKVKTPAGLDSSKLVAGAAKDGESGGTHYRHPVVPLGHLEDPTKEELQRLGMTKEEVQARVDSLVAKLADPATRQTYEIAEELIKIGRPAFPILLNLFYQIHNSENPDSYESRITLARVIVQVIIPMTRCDYGYSPRVKKSADPGAEAAKRQEALEKYYGWWGVNSRPRDWERLRKLREKEENTRIEGL